MSTGARKYWDNHASGWDAIYLDESPLARMLNQKLRRAIYERFHIALTAPGDLEGKSVLDVGCGSGRLTIEALKLGARRAVGIDFASSMLEIARKGAADAGVSSRAEFIQGDFLQAAVSERFDLVVANGVFDYIAEPRTLLEKMVSLSDGYVVASFPGKSLIRNLLRKIRYGLQGCPVYFYEESEVRQIARDAGLKEYEIITIPHSGTGYMLVGNTRG